MLLFVQLLQVDQGVRVLRLEPQHLAERLERPIDEPAALVVEAQAQQDVGVLQARELRALEQLLVDRDGPADLPLLPVQVAEDQLDLEGVGLQARRLGEFARWRDPAGRPPAKFSPRM